MISPHEIQIVRDHRGADAQVLPTALREFMQRITPRED